MRGLVDSSLADCFDRISGTSTSYAIHGGLVNISIPLRGRKKFKKEALNNGWKNLVISPRLFTCRLSLRSERCCLPMSQRRGQTADLRQLAKVKNQRYIVANGKMDQAPGISSQSSPKRSTTTTTTEWKYAWYQHQKTKEDYAKPKMHLLGRDFTLVKKWTIS